MTPAILPEAVAASLAPQLLRADRGENVTIQAGGHLYVLHAARHFHEEDTTNPSPELIARIARAEANVEAGHCTVLHNKVEIIDFMESLKKETNKINQSITYQRKKSWKKRGGGLGPAIR